MLLGWSLDDKTEDFTRDEMIANFSLERVNKGPASFDANKLMSFQDRYMQRYPIKSKVARCVDVLKKSGLVSNPPPCDIGTYIHDIVQAAGDRIRYPGSILDFEDFFTADAELPIDEKIFKKRIQDTPGSRELLQSIRDMLVGIQVFNASGIEHAIREQLEENGRQLSDATHALRLALTGKGVGFGLFETMAILGKERSLRRIDRLLALDPK